MPASQIDAVGVRILPVRQGCPRLEMDRRGIVEAGERTFPAERAAASSSGQPGSVVNSRDQCGE